MVWTAEPGTQVGPGQYQDFSLSVGPLPDAGTEVLLPAVQTLSDGETVAWDDEPLPDGVEPEHPAPVLVTTAAADDGPGHSAQPASGASDGASSATAPGASSGTDAPARDDAARWLGGAGFALGLAALLVAVVRRRRPAGPADRTA